MPARTDEAKTEVKLPSNAELLDALLTMPGNAYGAYSRFHSYSPRNIGWFYMQGIEPQPVATYNKWTELGRQVVKGSRARYVLRPITVRTKDEAGEPTDHMFTRFKAVKAIFPLADTEGEELPPLETPKWTLERALGNLAITQVPFESFEGDCQGYSFDRNIAINPVAVNPLKTAVHELAHVVLGHTVAGSQAEYVQHRGTKEFQAESTAYLTLNELEAMDELTASRSRAYCQTWLKGERPSDVAIGQVFAAHDEILRSGLEVA